MIEYNKELADKLAKDFEELTGIDLNDGSRKTEVMIARTLFYKILRDINFMKDRMIASWFKSRGVKRDRSSIFQSLQKINIYYKSYASFRNVYNIYFNDKAEEFITLEKSKRKALKDIKDNLKTNIANKGKDGLEVIINTVTNQYRRDELRDLVDMRIKSWSWKSKDEYQIIEAKAFGADVILLIAAILTRDEIKQFSETAKSLNLEVLLEVHNEAELQKSIMPSLDMLGVNNRNLKSFEVSLETSMALSNLIPNDFVKVSESGISSIEAIKQLQPYGYQGFLIGENFMKTDDPGLSAKVFINELKK